jgi:hypothetical protein
MVLADWDRRLIAPETALNLTGDIGVYFTCQRADLTQYEPEGGGPRLADQIQVNMRCSACHQSITLLARAGLAEPEVSGQETSLGDLMSDILRHQVMAHDQPLSGGRHHG